MRSTKDPFLAMLKVFSFVSLEDLIQSLNAVSRRALMSNCIIVYNEPRITNYSKHLSF